MPRSSCIHRALPPSGPPNGVRRCSLEGSTSGPPPPAISPPESSRSWWCCRSCLLLAAVRGAQPRGGWRSSAIARLQGFSSSAPGRRASRVGAPPSAWAGGSLLPLAFGGEGRLPALRRRQTLGTRARPTAGAANRRVPGALAWVASAPPLTLPPATWSGRGCPSTARAMVAPCVGPPHPRLLPRRRPHRGVVQDAVRRGGRRPRSWMVLSSLSQ
jgi:hypothetical protein